MERVKQVLFAEGFSLGLNSVLKRAEKLPLLKFTLR